MYPEEIETLIKSIVADGEYTMQERKVLHKKAMQLGIDVDELDVYVEGLTHVAKTQAEAKAEEPIASMNNKMGNVRKCPNCGAPIGGGMVKCPDCGYVFTNVSANSSAQQLAAQIAHCNLDEMKKIILHFPIPTTKDDLLEFLISLKTKKDLVSDSVEDKSLIPVYEAKYKEVKTKAVTLFPDDPELKNLLDNSNELKEGLISVVKRGGKWVFCFAIFIILFVAGIIAYSLRTTSDSFKAELKELIFEKKYDEAITYYNKYPEYGGRYSDAKKELTLALANADRPNDAVMVLGCEGAHRHWGHEESIHYAISDSYIRTHNYEKAIEEYNTVSNSSVSVCYKKIIEAMCKEGMISDAKKFKERILLDCSKKERVVLSEQLNELIKFYEK
ncbi:MAG: zinc ribbon domain-containing protein [Paludibacteraceae bacterium]|nr:zinc ribbon domain-containing protein [Paludibacteraceae bacterium]